MKGLILMGALLGAMASSPTRAESANYAGSPEAAIDEAVDAVCHMARVDAGAVKMSSARIYRGNVPPVAAIELGVRMPTEPGKPWAVRHLKYMLKQEPGKNRYGWLITDVYQQEAD
jgi:hypothetical protein